MNTECIVPDWLHDIFLGYDDPGAAHYSRYNDTCNLVFSSVTKTEDKRENKHRFTFYHNTLCGYHLCHRILYIFYLIDLFIEFVKEFFRLESSS